MPTFGPAELRQDVFGRDLCIGCGACVDLCPYFKNHRGKTVMLFACDLSRGRCFAYCPKADVDLDALAAARWGKPYDPSGLGSYLAVHAARAGAKMPSAAFQAGGTVSALMTAALELQLIDAAVLTDRRDLVAVPRLVTRPEDVVKCAGSKYMAAPTLATLNQGVQKGFSRLGVVGTPCQMTSAAQLRANPLGKKDFKDPVALTVGLFCTWALDTRKLMPLVTECVGGTCILGMDMPPPPAEIMIIDTGHEKVKIPLDRIRPLVPHGCRICPDMTAEWADVSVGVLESRPGWNTLIVRTAAGQQLVAQALREGFLQTEKLPAENLAHLMQAAAGKKKRALLLAIDEGLLNTEGDSRRAALRIRPATVKKIIT